MLSGALTDIMSISSANQTESNQTMERQQLRLGDTIHCALEMIRHVEQVLHRSSKLMPAHSAAFICKLARRMLEMHAEHSLFLLPVKRDRGDEMHNFTTKRLIM